jgi:hypothetical protein
MGKVLAVLALAFLAGSASAQTMSKDVTVKTDRFTGFTKMEMKPFDIGPYHGFPDASHTDGHAILTLFLTSGGGQIMFTVESTANHWQFLEGADVRVLADGQRIDLGHFSPRKGVMDTAGGVTMDEKIFAIVERDKLRQIANAKEVEVRVGPYPSKLTANNIKCLKEFSDALPVAAASKQ